MKKLILTTAIAAIVGMSSCKRNDDTVAPAPKAANISELNVAPSFNWSTVKTVNFQVAGIAAYVEVKRKLVVKDDKGAQVFATIHDMKDNLATTIQLPSIATKVFVEYGTIKKEVAIVGNIIKFDFTPGITNDAD